MAIQSKNIAPPDRVRIRRAVISVFDKSGIGELGAALAAHGVELLSTGGTARVLAKAGLPVTDISDVTGFPEILDGRVKTLHPAVHGGLLSIRGDETHVEQMQAHGIGAIDLLVADLYPFEEAASAGASFADTVENIDIGGPAMIRAAAKNHAYVTVVADPLDRQVVLDEMNARDGTIGLELRKRLAAAAFAHTAAYDGMIAGWFADRLGIEYPRRIALPGRLAAELRYGENPHQSAALYVNGERRPGVATARQHQGKQLSFNNINDADAAFELVSEFDPGRSAAVAIIKHANPCGVAVAATLAVAYERALACDPVSAFGGIVAVNCELDAEAAERITRLFTEVIIAPAASPEAVELIAAKKNLRLLTTGALADPAAPGRNIRSVAGGYLVQTRDNGRAGKSTLSVVTRRKPSAREVDDLLFAFTVAKHVKSNTIVYARDGASVGIGAGQMSRVDSARIAAQKAREGASRRGDAEPPTQGSVAASDAFFPFADGLQAVIEAGATAVIQPGGSMRDDEVIAAADAAGIAMVMTGIRHFRH